jgi:hypothetical protein
MESLRAGMRADKNFRIPQNQKSEVKEKPRLSAGLSFSLELTTLIAAASALPVLRVRRRG